MPAGLSDPGVDIEEFPGGVRTIAGVAASITAFVGRTASGPVDQPMLLNSWADYHLRFGGLSADSTVSYAVRDFYANGGSQALVVRVAHADANKATISLDTNLASPIPLVLEASSEGNWGNRLSVAVDHDSDGALPSASPSAQDLHRFNLTVRWQVRTDREDFSLESFLFVSTDESDPRFLPRVLENESLFLRVRGSISPVRPDSNVKSVDSVKTIEWVPASGGEDGGDLDSADVKGDENLRTGLYALSKADLFNLLCIPPINRNLSTSPPRYTSTSGDIYRAALTLCVARRAMLIVDPDPAWGVPLDQAVGNTIQGANALALEGSDARNAALYFPCVQATDSLRDDQIETFVPCGIVAGIIARTDKTRGVWKAPAGLDASLEGVQGLQLNVNNLQNGQLNQLGINCLRSVPGNGLVVWGARTMRGGDQAADEYKYVPVRRLALYIEESLHRGTQWVVFEPNDESSWAQVRLAVREFMQNLFRQGAFQGSSPRQAYFVKCDAETTTQDDVDLGIVNILVGFAPLKPAEFLFIRIQRLAGQIQK